MVRTNLIWVSLCLAGLAGCSDVQQTSVPTTTQPKQFKVTQIAEKQAAPTPPNDGPSDQKEMLGLDLPPINGWKPVWDAQAKAARWEHGEYMSCIVVRLVTEKLDGIEDLKQAAPWMLQLGSAITKVVEVRQTSRGWYAVVRRGKEKDLVYVLRYQPANVVCSARLTRSEIKTIKKKTALAACDSIRVRSRSDRARSEVPTDRGTR